WPRARRARKVLPHPAYLGGTMIRRSFLIIAMTALSLFAIACGDDGKPSAPDGGDCLALAAACTSGAECCSEHCSEEGICATPPVTPQCEDVGGACEAGDACCSGNCSAGGICVGEFGVCAALSEDCESDVDCCSGSCGPASKCILAEGSCRIAALSCTSNHQCCSGRCASGVCVPPIGVCQPLNASCSS